jgi:hypothetical protein
VDEEPTRDPDDDDQDLLTFNESRVRLHTEIVATRAALAAADAPERAALQRRLSALTDALERNTRHTATIPGEAGFLTYRPPGG